MPPRAAEPGHLASFNVELEVVIRPCKRDDLPALGWFGLFEAELLERVFERHERGETLALVAEANNSASGQLWVEFESPVSPRTGVLWALRVLPNLQSLGVGASLIAAGERALAGRGCEHAELTVETDNHGALRLYERLGYRRTALVPPDHHRLAIPPCARARTRREWLLRKPLAEAPNLHAPRAPAEGQ